MADVSAKGVAAQLATAIDRQAKVQQAARDTAASIPSKPAPASVPGQPPQAPR